MCIRDRVSTQSTWEAPKSMYESIAGEYHSIITDTAPVLTEENTFEEKYTNLYKNFNALKKERDNIFKKIEDQRLRSELTAQKENATKSVAQANDKYQLFHLFGVALIALVIGCLLYTSPSPRDLSTSRMPSSA
eukprot:TRINITY_DN17017_c0_g1_i1.p2 TRINITY_DN17017_c0_g1~~TRINITY_DN17017_c0_g1_i1.p2  ORF type:complete len:134 (+),score=43.54 TRINITY_DN17017_c0_g1_i1:152-553(+)